MAEPAEQTGAWREGVNQPPEMPAGSSGMGKQLGMPQGRKAGSCGTESTTRRHSSRFRFSSSPTSSTPALPLPNGPPTSSLPSHPPAPHPVGQFSSPPPLPMPGSWRFSCPGGFLLPGHGPRLLGAARGDDVRYVPAESVRKSGTTPPDPPPGPHAVQFTISPPLQDPSSPQRRVKAAIIKQPL